MPVVGAVTTFFTVSRAPRALAGEATAEAALGGTGEARVTLASARLAAPPLHLRHTAACRPCVTPTAARHRLGAITTADCANTEDSHPPGAPALNRPRSRSRVLCVTHDAHRALLTVILLGSDQHL